MNFMGKSTGDSGSSTSSRRQQQNQQGGGGGNLFEEEDEEERQNTAAPIAAGQSLFPSSSSSSPSSSHHHHHHHQHHQHKHPFLHQPPYHQRSGGNWVFDGTTGAGEPSSSSRPISADPMITEDYNSVNPPADTTDNYKNDNVDAEGGGSAGMMMVVEREHMFDKVVTPSDVGKLNRLVIPKQHAERYFPLDSSTNDKGLLLNFEDRNGKPWRFRYSYWNSSQSYVMTKGWSRFVKDKKLDAGDIVSFQRGVGGSAKDRLFIDWRHRPDAPLPHHHPPYQLSSFPLPPHHQFSFRNTAAAAAGIHPWNPLFFQSQPPPPPLPRTHFPNTYPPPSYRSYGGTGTGGGGPYHSIGTGSVVNVNQGGSGSVIYFRSGVGGGGVPHQQQQQHAADMMMMQRSGVGVDPPAAAASIPPGVVFESVPVVHGKAAAKRLRLFGVNMDCPISDDVDDQLHDYDIVGDHQFHVSPTTAAAASITTNSIPMGLGHRGNYHHDEQLLHYNQPPSSSSSTIPYLQLRPNYEEEEEEEEEEETQFHQASSSSTDQAFNKTTKSSSSHMSLDLDI